MDGELSSDEVCVRLEVFEGLEESFQNNELLCLTRSPPSPTSGHFRSLHQCSVVVIIVINIVIVIVVRCSKPDS